MRIVIVLIIVFFLACSEKKNHPLSEYLRNKVIIDLNQPFKTKPSLSSLTINGSFLQNGDSCYSLIDYQISKIYIFNRKKNCFVQEFSIPKTCYIADVLKVINMDSIFYLNNQTHSLILCDTARIKKEYKVHNFYKDSNIIITRINNNLIKWNKKIIFDLLIQNFRIQSNYFTLRQNTPIVGLFEINESRLEYTAIPVFHPNIEGQNKRMIQNFLFFDINARENLLIYTTHNNPDEIFTYNLKSSQTSKHHVTNSAHLIVPIIYYLDSLEKKGADAYNILIHKQSTCARFIFNENTNTIFRMLKIREGKSNSKRYLQILNLKFEVVLECEIPDQYDDIREVDGEILFHRIDLKKRRIIYEKFDCSL